MMHSTVYVYVIVMMFHTHTAHHPGSSGSTWVFPAASQSRRHHQVHHKGGGGGGRGRSFTVNEEFEQLNGEVASSLLSIYSTKFSSKETKKNLWLIPEHPPHLQ